MKEAKISDLQFGDLIIVEWLDASEATSTLKQGNFDTPVHSIGYFLGVKGRKTKHIVIAKEIIDFQSYHYNVIPFGMIQQIKIERKNALKPKMKKILRKFAAETIFRLRKKDGWVYAKKMAT